MKIISLDIEERMKGLGYYQLIGGVLGILLSLYSLALKGELTGLTLLLYLIAFSLFSLSIYSGNLLRKANIKGLSLSKWNQSLQVFKISLLGLTYAYYSGINISAGIDWTTKLRPDFVLSFFGGEFKYSSQDDSEVKMLVNIVPLIILYWIYKIENDIQERREIKASAEKEQSLHNIK